MFGQEYGLIALAGSLLAAGIDPGIMDSRHKLSSSKVLIPTNSPPNVAKRPQKPRSGDIIVKPPATPLSGGRLNLPKG
jgi:hypothetical protein